MRVIALGNNLGNKDSQLEENDVSDLVYTGDFASIKNTFYMYLAAWRCLQFDELISKEYREWCQTDEFKLQDTMYYLWSKKFELLNEKYPDEYLKMGELLDKTIDKYKNMFNFMDASLKNTDINEFTNKIDIQNELVDQNNRTLLIHNIPLSGNMTADIDGFYSRKELGFLPSELFGILEKFGECRFCTSFTKRNASDLFKIHDNVKEEKAVYFDKPTNKDSIDFLIDAESPTIMQSMRVDYFGFLKNRKNNNLDEYSQSELLFLNQLYDWNNGGEASDPVLSNLNGGTGAGLSVASQHENWVAIPGGISSKLVIGIIAKTSNSREMACEAGKIFEVPVMDKYGTVIQNSCENQHRI